MRTRADNEYCNACLLGKAESLASLQRYAAAAENYKEAIEAMQRSSGSMLLDAKAIRESLRALAMLLSQQDRPTEALPFVQLAERLVPVDETDTLADLVELQARICVQAGDDALSKARETEAGSPPPVSAATPMVPAAATVPASRPATQAAATTKPAHGDPRTEAHEYFAQAGGLYSRLSQTAGDERAVVGGR